MIFPDLSDGPARRAWLLGQAVAETTTLAEALARAAALETFIRTGEAPSIALPPPESRRSRSPSVGRRRRSGGRPSAAPSPEGPPEAVTRPDASGPPPAASPQPGRRRPCRPSPPDRPAQPAPGSNAARVLERVRAGETQAQIARALGMSPAGVTYHRKRLRKAGLLEPTRTGRPARPLEPGSIADKVLRALLHGCAAEPKALAKACETSEAVIGQGLAVLHRRGFVQPLETGWRILRLPDGRVLPARDPAAEAAALAEAEAAGRVTRCPPAYVAPVAGAARLAVPSAGEAPARLSRATRRGARKGAARSKVGPARAAALKEATDG